jgi:DNA-binding HxlR family transcriptional regulator
MESNSARVPSGVQPSVYLKNCVTREILNRVANKWTTLIIGILSSVPSVRFTELSRTIGGISQKMLTQTLRELERDGLVSRKVFPQVPPRVEYALTPLGQTLCEPLRALAEWAEAHMTEIRAAEEQFDAVAAQAEATPEMRLPSEFKVGTGFSLTAHATGE